VRTKALEKLKGLRARRSTTPPEKGKKKKTAKPGNKLGGEGRGSSLRSHERQQRRSDRKKAPIQIKGDRTAGRTKARTNVTQSNMAGVGGGGGSLM